MKTYIAYLDILGFTNIVEKNGEDKLTEIVESFWRGFNDSVNESRTIQHSNGAWSVSLKELEFRLISDSIIIWTTNSCFRNFLNLLTSVSHLLSYGAENGFPLRGTINYGDLISFSFEDGSFFKNESIYGKAYIDAYLFEEALDWSGCIITPEAWNQICNEQIKPLLSHEDINSLFYIFSYLVWYKVPFKGGRFNAVSVNWNRGLILQPQKIINEEAFNNSFIMYRTETTSSTACKKEKVDITKIKETRKFLEYTTELQKNIPCYYPDKCSVQIPVPNDDYRKTNNKVFLKRVSGKCILTTWIQKVLKSF